MAELGIKTGWAGIQIRRSWTPRIKEMLENSSLKPNRRRSLLMHERKCTDIINPGSWSGLKWEMRPRKVQINFWGTDFFFFFPGMLRALGE